MSRKSGAQRRKEQETRAIDGGAPRPSRDSGVRSGTREGSQRGAPVESLRGGALQLRDAELFPLAEVRETIQWEAERYFKAGLTGALTLDQVTTLILTGRDLGLPPSQALTGLYVEEGKIAMQADLMRALILRSGTGMIEPVTADETRCVVRAVRYGQRGRLDTVFEIEWNQKLAEKAGLWGKKSWQSYPRQLLFARATSEAGRTLFSDVLCGVIYTPEELGGVPDVSSLPGGAAPVPPAVGTGKRPPAPAVPRPQASETPVTPSGIPVSSPAQPAGARWRDGEGQGKGVTPPVAPAAPSAAVDAFPDAVSGKATPRALTTVLHGEKPDGGVTTVMTAGLTKPQLQMLKALTTPEGGHPSWEQNKAAGAAYVKARGLPSVLHLTEQEGHELIAQLMAATGQLGPGAVPDDARRAAEAELERVIVAAGQERQLVVDTLCRIHGVARLEDLDTATLVHGVDEVREMTKDTAQMQLVLERLRQQHEIGA